MPVYDIETREQFESLLKQYRVIIVDVWSKSCGPCVALAPRYTELATKYGSDQVVFTKNNADHMIFADVTGLPTILFFVQGALFHKVLGANVKEIEATIIKAIGGNVAVVSQEQNPPENVKVVNKKSQSQYKTYADI